MENQVIGRCRLVRKLGEGGMGVVWLARHETLQKDVAVKVLPPEASKEPEAVERLLREARNAARLEHPNVIQVLDAGSDGGAHFIVMQYVDGTDLDRILEKKGKLAHGEALSVTKKVAQALGAAHKLGIIHRDIKPANIMVTKQGRVMVGDFGIARDVESDAGLTTAGQVLGTPHYIAPEQARGEKLDGRCDLYALGCSLYCMLSGRPPYKGTSPMAILVKHTTPGEKPEPLRNIVPEIPEEVEALVGKMMAKPLDRRFQSAEEVVAAIDRIKSGGATMVNVAEEKVLTPRRRKKLLIAGAGAGLGGLFLLIFLLVLLGPSKAEKAWRVAEASATEETKLVHLREIIADFPGTEWAARAQGALRAIVEREVKAAVALASDGKTPFQEVMNRLDVLRGKFPGAKAELEKIELELHRARVVARTEGLAACMRSEKGEDHDKILEFVAPAVLREHGKRGIQWMIRVWLGVALGAGVRVEKADVRKAEAAVQSRKSATVPVDVVIHQRLKNERNEQKMMIGWEWTEGDWYLPEKPAQPK